MNFIFGASDAGLRQLIEEDEMLAEALSNDFLEI
jgi:hypothetical protein